MKRLGLKFTMLMALILVAHSLSAQEPDSLHRERSVLIEEPSDEAMEERNRQLYDSLQQRSRNSKVGGLLYDMLVVEPDNKEEPREALRDESRHYAPYSGRTIVSIQIERHGVFNREGSWVERAGNAIHLETREQVILRDLLLEVGDTINPDQLVRNIQLLRSRKYISDAELKVVPDPKNPQYVHIRVRTRDSWTITPGISLHGDGETTVSLSDENFLGTGNYLEVATHFNRRDFSYGGNILTYRMPNIWGTFIEGDFSVGREFAQSEFKAQISKALLEPTDYLFGVAYNRLREEFHEELYPDITTTLERRINFWGGYSHQLKGRKFSLYAMGHYQHFNFKDRPEVAYNFNPFYHRGEQVLTSLGIYRENFYTANMIYGYGTREYIPTGYRAEIMSGYNWGEFRNDLYLGMGLYHGDFRKSGYYAAGLAFGSYLSLSNGRGYQTMADADFRWFSNLKSVRKCHVRQFVNLHYTHGWNRGEGLKESIEFTGNDGIRVYDDEAEGIQRLVLNTETVVFTPLQPWGFRITCFGFADAGVIGPSNNIARNSLFGAVGFGIRIRNERLVFGAIEIRLGIAFGKGGWADSEWFRITSQDRYEQPRYLPEYPEMLRFE